MSNTNDKELVLQAILPHSLQEASADMTGTELYAREQYIPDFQAAKAAQNMMTRNAGRENGFVCRSTAGRKVERIAESKAQLSDYLLCHPMQWTDGQYYAITAEKQQQLTSKIMSATLAAQTGTPYSLTWNATGEECQAWTLENLTALAFAIDARVTSLVSYQQAREVEMRDASTLEALEAIPVDYDSVPLPGGETA